MSGLFCIMFGLIAAVGLSQMQHADQNSPRNIFILGFALYMGLSVPYYFVRALIPFANAADEWSHHARLRSLDDWHTTVYEFQRIVAVSSGLPDSQDSRGAESF